ncbi:unnamed protein product [Ceutorhynchus assimilis]|uniref:CCHC-type domain-containing protein n=1 Tax=Ceutorhynchus assimilis TaxID=467358 RepID=A0A9N9MSH7_9CUCU|nr:unnamed protein product [Ceutorhynchus assimilis]
MVYGILHGQIREKAPRDKVASFSELPTHARLAEETFDVSSEPTAYNDSGAVKKRCSFCKYTGHTFDDCGKRINKNKSADKLNSPSVKPSVTLNLAKPPELSASSVTCYGCGAQGYLKSYCPNCKPKQTYANMVIVGRDVEFLFNSVDDKTLEVRPLVPLAINGHRGCAFVDTSAKRSVAGATLSRLLLNDSVPFTIERLLMTLADGVMRIVDSRIFRCDVLLQNRLVPTKFISVPEYDTTTAAPRSAHFSVLISSERTSFSTCLKTGIW